MRVLLVNDFEHKGGAEVVMHAQRAALSDAGHDVEIFAGDAEQLRRTPWSYIDSHEARRKLRRMLLAFDPDVVHIHNLYHLLSPGVLGEVARWNSDGRVIAMHVHDLNVACPSPVIGARNDVAETLSAARRFGSIALRRWDDRGRAHSFLRAGQWWWNYEARGRLRAVDVLIAPSAWAGTHVTGCGPPVRLVRNPVVGPSCERVKPSAGPIWTMVFVGRLEPEKGLLRFIDSISGVEGVRLVVLGEGTERGRCERAVSDAGIECEFLGWVDQSRVAHEIAAADALLLPSVVHENAPLVVFDAIGASTMPIVSNAGGLPEIIERFGVGELFDPFDPGSVRRVIDDARTNPPSAKRWARASAMLSDQTCERFASELVAVYREFGCAS